MTHESKHTHNTSRTDRVLLRLAVIFLLASAIFAAALASAQVRNPYAETQFKPSIDLLDARPDAEGNLQAYQVAIQKVIFTSPEVIKINLPGYGVYRFQKAKPLADDFSVVSSSGDFISGNKLPQEHYTTGRKNGFGAISFFPGYFIAIISVDSGQVIFQQSEKNPGKYQIIKEWQHKLKFTCHVEDKDEELEDLSQSQNRMAVTSCKVARVYFEADYHLYQSNGSNLVASAQFVTGLFNVVAGLYAAENVSVEVSQVFVWDTPDPYRTMTSAGQVLVNFAGTRTTFNGNTAMFLSTRPASMGGVAYTDQLCKSFSHSFSNIFGTYNALPTYSWSTYVIAHELGHNYSLKHTFWAGWPWRPGTFTGPTCGPGAKGQIDSTWAGENQTGACNYSASSKSVAGGGTIMSYAHLTQTGVNYNKGFGPIPGDQLGARINSATCLSSVCLADPVLEVDSALNRDGNFRLRLLLPANHNANSYTIYEGNFNTVATGIITSQNAVTINLDQVRANGTYEFFAIVANAQVEAQSEPVTAVVDIPVAITATCIDRSFAPLLYRSGTAWRGRFRITGNGAGRVWADLDRRVSSTLWANGPRLTNYQPTTGQIASGEIDFLLNPQPWNLVQGTPLFGQTHTYRLRVWGNGSGCNNANLIGEPVVIAP